MVLYSLYSTESVLSKKRPKRPSVVLAEPVVPVFSQGGMTGVFKAF